MSWEQKVVEYEVVHGTPDTWAVKSIVAVLTNADTLRVKNLFLRGFYSVSQPTEDNAQGGTIFFSLYLATDQIATPDPGDPTDGLGLDFSLKGGRFVLASGQNNPVLFQFRYRAINVKPGMNLYLVQQIVRETHAGLLHHVQVAGDFWQSND